VWAFLYTPYEHGQLIRVSRFKDGLVNLLILAVQYQWPNVR